MRTEFKPLLIAMGLITGLAVTTLARANDDMCSAATLHGLYVFHASGYNVSATGTVPKAIVESIRFMGDGTLTVPGATRSVNGTIVRSLPNGGGTYTIAPNCSGTITFAPGPSFDIVISPGGGEIFMIQTSDPTGAGPVLQGVAERVWH